MNHKGCDIEKTSGTGFFKNCALVIDQQKVFRLNQFEVESLRILLPLENGWLSNNTHERIDTESTRVDRILVMTRVRLPAFRSKVVPTCLDSNVSVNTLVKAMITFRLVSYEMA